MKENPPSRRIHILRDSVSRLIAAGEVIERPASVVRELLDNAIDAGANRIELHLEGGGVSSIRLIDNGCGMDRENLELCFQAHATSKIGNLQDLDSLSSLGFRGEALSSIAACSKLTITSSEDGGEAHYITLHGGSVLSSGSRAGNKGTIVEVSDLFYSMPARKKFLKRPSSETNLCAAAFMEKATAFPHLAFRMLTDGKVRYALEPEDPRQRIENLYGATYGLRSFSSEHDGFSLLFIAGDPSLPRRDRRLLQVFVQGRRIYDYALLQALEYAYGTPGGYRPVCFLFITIKAHLVDFNIHPAKREVRFRNLPEIHRAVTGTLQGKLSDPSSRRPGISYSSGGTGEGDLFAQAEPSYHPTGSGIKFPEEWAQVNSLDSLPTTERSYRYLGQLFGVFLLVERGTDLLFIDQHAAHERILYNELVNKARHHQDLLVPVMVEVEPDTERVLKASQESLREIGITFEFSGPGTVYLLTLPSGCEGQEDLVAEFLSEMKGTEKNLLARLYSTLACRGAIKEGAFIDHTTALALIDRVLAMEDPHCPHGRPIIFATTRDFLYRQVKRV
ncbi:MAG: DNA mismatch repair endonuclease MutL [Spirochaetales bacterium]|nr:DNA mismatch repair endonuclease MutL [Spirochaetales bacterium]